MKVSSRKHKAIAIGLIAFFIAGYAQARTRDYFITAEDVVYTMQQSMSDESSSLAKSYMSIIESIEEVDDYTVVVHQSEPNVDYADMDIFQPNEFRASAG